MIEVDLAAPLAERLLETKFHVFKHRTRVRRHLLWLPAPGRRMRG